MKTITKETKTVEGVEFEAGVYVGYGSGLTYFVEASGKGALTLGTLFKKDFESVLGSAIKADDKFVITIKKVS